jgi:hypothetical protein
MATRYFYGRIAPFAVFPMLALSQGGPPFLSDDPDTPGKGHWEINMGFLGDRSPFRGSYQTPDLDINYGLGNRIQLKYELPLAIQETRGDSGRVAAGLGNSLLGVKYRFYERHYKTKMEDGEREIKFSLSTYPQLLLNNPTRSVVRGIVDPGPLLLLPLEASLKKGPIRISAETGYWFSTTSAPSSWIRGIVVGHEFKRDTELYGEIYDQQYVGAIRGNQNIRESTAGIGGRVPIVRGHWLRLIGMAGHGLVSATLPNGQPT